MKKILFIMTLAFVGVCNPAKAEKWHFLKHLACISQHRDAEVCRKLCSQTYKHPGAAAVVKDVTQCKNPERPIDCQCTFKQ